MIVEYIIAKECKNEEVWCTCYKCGKWKDCKTKWCNGDGGFWCKEDCKLLQVNSPSNRKKVEKILSNGDAVYVLYADGTWRKKEKK